MLAGGSYGSLQLVQIFRTSRWASTPISEAATRYGSTPMFSRRVTAPGASLVCSVREHQVPGQGRLDGDAGGLLVADLADHDDVRVLPQQATAGPWRR